MANRQWKMLESAADVAIARLSGMDVEEMDGLYGQWKPSHYRDPKHVRLGFYYRGAPAIGVDQTEEHDER